MASILDTHPQLDQTRIIGLGRLWQRYGKIIRRPSLPWLRKTTSSRFDNWNKQDQQIQHDNVTSPSPCIEEIIDNEMVQSMVKDIGIDRCPDIPDQPSHAAGSSYLQSTKRLQDILEDITQSEEKRLLETLQKRDRNRSLRRRAQSNLDTDRDLPPLPPRCSSIGRHEFAKPVLVHHKSPSLGHNPRRSAAFATLPRAIELPCEDPRAVSATPRGSQESWTSVDTPMTPLSSNIRSVNRKYSFSDGHLFMPVLERQESDLSTSSQDMQSQRSSTTLVELDAWPVQPMVELYTGENITKIGSPQMQQYTNYGDKKFRTLPGEAFPLC